MVDPGVHLCLKFRDMRYPATLSLRQRILSGRAKTAAL
jgi:hypothetical protein